RTSVPWTRARITCHDSTHRASASRGPRSLFFQRALAPTAVGLGTDARISWYACPLWLLRFRAAFAPQRPGDDLDRGQELLHVTPSLTLKVRHRPGALDEHRFRLETRRRQGHEFLAGADGDGDLVARP